MSSTPIFPMLSLQLIQQENVVLISELIRERAFVVASFFSTTHASRLGVGPNVLIAVNTREIRCFVVCCSHGKNIGQGVRN